MGQHYIQSLVSGDRGLGMMDGHPGRFKGFHNSHELINIVQFTYIICSCNCTFILLYLRAIVLSYNCIYK